MSAAATSCKTAPVVSFESAQQLFTSLETLANQHWSQGNKIYAQFEKAVLDSFCSAQTKIRAEQEKCPNKFAARINLISKDLEVLQERYTEACTESDKKQAQASAQLVVSEKITSLCENVRLLGHEIKAEVTGKESAAGEKPIPLAFGLRKVPSSPNEVFAMFGAALPEDTLFTPRRRDCNTPDIERVLSEVTKMVGQIILLSDTERKAQFAEKLVKRFHEQSALLTAQVISEADS